MTNRRELLVGVAGATGDWRRYSRLGVCVFVFDRASSVAAPSWRRSSGRWRPRDSASPEVLLVGGDAGVGKSTLVLEGARRGGAEIVCGRCVPMGGELIPLAPLVDLLRDVRRTQPDILACAVDWRRCVSGPHRTPWPTPGALTPGRLFGAVLELVGSLPDGGVAVVAFEDLHWADPLTWDLFDFLARNLVDERVVLVGTYRADEVSANAEHRRRLGELARLQAVHRLHLAGLDRARWRRASRT